MVLCLIFPRDIYMRRELGVTKGLEEYIRCVLEITLNVAVYDMAAKKCGPPGLQPRLLERRSYVMFMLALRESRHAFTQWRSNKYAMWRNLFVNSTMNLWLRLKEKHIQNQKRTIYFCITIVAFCSSCGHLYKVHNGSFQLGTSPCCAKPDPVMFCLRLFHWSSRWTLDYSRLPPELSASAYVQNYKY